DRRSMRSGGHSQASGVLVGHSEGITYVTSKGDNRYLASNGKDQKMLLWDLRMMQAKASPPRMSGFDYRDESYRRSKSYKVKGDCSVMTFQGHKVLRTLIRCHFSPVSSTGQRYLYTGSADGMIAIYRLDGTLVRKLDTSAPFADGGRSRYTARDVSWHPYHPTIMSSCVGGPYDPSGGIVRHTFSIEGDSEMDGSESSEEITIAPPRRRRRFQF
ncbi:hypothetical protein BGZ76_006897, partial [Entomortierella beljakovae]